MEKNFNLHPSQQPFIERPQLFKTLNKATRHKLTLIIAPPGYGKTTLASQFVRKTNIPTAWQMLEKQDQDLPNLFEHSINALSQVVPEIGTLSAGTDTTARELANITTDYLREKTSNDFLYIMDDVHHLLDPVGSKTWLKSFIATMPSTCHLILIGQALPPLPIAELIAHGELVSIGQEQLSFSREEVELLAETLGSKLPVVQIDNIFSRMVGWPAGTLLALQPLPFAIEATLFDGKSAPETLFDALAYRLFYAQPLALQSFLLSASTLSRITPHLCQSALHLQNSLQHLTEALHRNLFITEIPTGIVFHSLFRDFLQRELQIQDFHQFTQHHIRAGEWFENENRLDEAFEHFTLAGQWDRAVAIADRSAQMYMASRKIETLLRWKAELNSFNLKIPRLLHMCAMIHRDRYEYELANQALADAADGFQAQGNRIGLVQITLLKATIDNQHGYFHKAIDTATPFIHDSSIAPNLRGYAVAIVGTGTLYLGHSEAALELLEAALPLWRDTGDAFAVAHLLMTLEVAYLRLGRFLDAAQCVQEALAIRRDFGEMHGMVMVLNNLGYHQCLLGEYQQSLQTLNEALQKTQKVPETRAESYVLWTLGDLHRDQDAFDEADAFYQKSLRLMKESEPFLKANVLMSFATLKRWQGKLEAAQTLALEAKEIAGTHNLKWEAKLATLASTAICIEQGDYEMARPQLDMLVHDWLQHPAPQLAPSLGLAAYAALLAGDNGKAHHYLKLALTNAGHPANLQPLAAEIVHLPLLRAFVERYASRYTVLQQGISTLEAAQIERAEVQQHREMANLKQTYSLRVSVLGQELIERDGKKIPQSDWQAARARELFFYLLFNQPSTREKIGLALWPDSSIKQLRQTFHTTLRRIRDAVGTNAILFDNGLYSINPHLELWCDVFEFKDVVKKAQLSSPLLPHTEILWQRAVDLFQGELLPTFDVYWVLSYREALTQMHMEALVSLAQCVRKRGDIQKAIELLKQALEIDSFREDIHRLLLKDYHALGYRGLIVNHMQNLTRLFWDELRTTPSAETLHLSKSLLA